MAGRARRRSSRSGRARPSLYTAPDPEPDTPQDPDPDLDAGPTVDADAPRLDAHSSTLADALADILAGAESDVCSDPDSVRLFDRDLDRAVFDQGEDRLLGGGDPRCPDLLARRSLARLWVLHGDVRRLSDLRPRVLVSPGLPRRSQSHQRR